MKLQNLTAILVNNLQIITTSGMKVSMYVYKYGIVISGFQSRQQQDEFLKIVNGEHAALTDREIVFEMHESEMKTFDQ